MVWNDRQTVQSPTWWKRPIVSSASPKHPAISPWEVLNLGEWFRHLSKELRFMFLIGRTSNKALVPSLLLGGECKGNPMNCNFFGEMWILWHQKLEEGSQKRQVLPITVWCYALSVYPPHFFLDSKDIWVDDLRSSHHTWKAIKKMFGWNGRGSQLALGAKELGPLWISTGKKRHVELLVVGNQKVERLLLLMEEILHQLRLVVSPIIYRVLYIPDSRWCKNQQYNPRKTNMTIAGKSPWMFW